MLATLSLRLRLFLLLGGLVALLVVAQWWLVRTLTGELSSEVGEVAFSVGRSLITAMDEQRVVVVDETARVEGTETMERHVSVLGVGPEGAVRQRVVVNASPEGGEEEGSAHSFAFEIRTEQGEDEPSTEPAAEPTAERSPSSLPPSPTDGPNTLVLKLEAAGGQGRALVLEGAGKKPRIVPIPIPQRGVDARLARFARRLLVGSLGILGLGLLAAAVVAHRVSAPLAGLRDGALRLAAGDLGTRVPETAGGEVGAAARAFNRMSSQLARLEEANRTLRAREHLAELGEVARGLAHSLRNPLNTLGLSVEELARQAAASGEEARGETEELAAGARRQIQRIDGAVRSLLVLGVEGGGGAVTESVDLSRLADDVALEALQNFRGRLHIEVETSGGEIPEGEMQEGEMQEGATQEGVPRPGALSVRGVAAELRALLQALVVNAAEASPEGGTVRVVLTPLLPPGQPVAGAEPRRVRLAVIDSGPGLAPEVRGRLFSPHVTTKPEGSGMGLYLAHRIATSRYGGTLEIGEAAGGGTRALLELGDRQDV